MLETTRNDGNDRELALILGVKPEEHDVPIPAVNETAFESLEESAENKDIPAMVFDRRNLLLDTTEDEVDEYKQVRNCLRLTAIETNSGNSCCPGDCILWWAQPPVPRQADDGTDLFLLQTVQDLYSPVGAEPATRRLVPVPPLSY